MRLFAGLPLPGFAVDRLSNLRLRLADPRDGLRWSEPAQWHITLQFYGELSAIETACLTNALREVPLQDVEVSLPRLGLFPSKGILFVAVELTGGLQQLEASIAQQSSTCGLVAESRPFRPHITLARSRNKTGVRTLEKLGSPSLPALAPIHWRAEEIVLYSSELLATGAEYTALARFPLHRTAATG